MRRQARLERPQSGLAEDLGSTSLLIALHASQMQVALEACMRQGITAQAAYSLGQRAWGYAAAQYLANLSTYNGLVIDE
jgi:hypothetical protein